MQVSDDEDSEDAEAWNAEAHFTNANYQAKKMIFLLFINRESVVHSVSSPIITLHDRPIGGIVEDQEGDRSRVQRRACQGCIPLRLSEVYFYPCTCLIFT